MTDDTNTTLRELSLNEKRLQALFDLSQMVDSPKSQVANFSLEAAVSLTSSVIGYLAFTSEDETQLQMFAWSRSAEAKCAVVEWPHLFEVEKAGLWAEGVRQRQPMIVNDFGAPNPLKRGFPEGHIPLTRYMHVPVVDGQHVVVVAGVANKASDYDESDLRQLTLLMQGMWSIMQRNETHLAIRRAKETAEETSRLKSEFLDLAAHELRTPLTVLSLRLQTLLRSARGQPVVAVEAERIEGLQHQADRLAQMVSDLLDSARLARGGLRPRPTRGDAVRALRTIVDTFRDRAPGRIVEWQGPDETAEVTLDLDQIQQVLANLLDNALKYSPPEGKITVSLQVRPLEIEVAVADEGAGLSDDDLARIFERFQRGRVTTAAQPPGLGLGLYVSRKMVELAGGSITARRRPGKGNVFTFVLPRQQVEAEAPAPP